MLVMPGGRLLAVCAALPLAAAAAQDRPARIELPMVPFVSWREAAGWTYPHRDQVNPSLPAATRMVVAYWYPELASRAALDSAQVALLSDTAAVARRPTTTGELKALIARGTPVVVTTALTPVSHPLATTFEMALKLGMVKATLPEGPRSGTLGRMLPLDKIDPFRKMANPVRESMLAAARVVIGYDDSRGVFLLHDPTFGPGWELPYQDFERMWAATDHGAMVMEPTDAATRLQGRSGESAYRARTPDELAAERFVYGYGHSAIGRLEQGEAFLRDGLGLPGVSAGYRHLLYFELALVLGERRRIDEGVAMADTATMLVPEDPGPWSFIAAAAKQSGSRAIRDRAKPADRRVRDLQADRQARSRLDAAIPADFWVQTLAPTRGWGVEAGTLTS